MEGWLHSVVRSRWTAPVLLLGFSQWEAWWGGPTNVVGPLWAIAIPAGVSALLLSWRRSAPLRVQVGCCLITMAPWFVCGAPEAASPAFVALVATFAVGRWASPPTAYLGIPIAAAWILAQISLDPLQSGGPDSWGWVLWGAAAWAAGAWLRQRLELEVHLNAQRAESTRAEVAEERLRIAREVHDVLANSLGIMVVHAEAAEELLSPNPARAAEAMRRVQSTGREALAELRAVLGVLRGGADRGETPAATLPDADLEHVQALVKNTRAAGLPVTYERIGVRQVPDDVARAIYRLVQEALTNVIRHAGPVATCVLLETSADGVTVEVTDSGQSRPQRSEDIGNGHGIIGMRERLQALGGTFEAGSRRRGGFRVRAHIPFAAPARPENKASPQDSRRAAT